MSKSRTIIERLFEGTTPVAPPPPTRPVPKTPGPLRPKPGTTPKHDPWRRREIRPGTAPRPKARREESKEDRSSCEKWLKSSKEERSKEDRSTCKAWIKRHGKDKKQMNQKKDVEESKSKKGKMVARAPGSVSYGKKRVKESLARRLLDS
jgi:hypothetical protein